MSNTNKHNTRLAIVGFGKFGQLLHQLFSQITWLELEVVSSQKLQSPVRQISYPELNTADIVIPCVPIRAFRQAITRILPHCRPGVTILDVCSVKVFPTQVLLAQATPDMNLIACHPMFGPTTIVTRGSAAGLPVTIWNVRSAEHAYSQVKRIWQELGVRLIAISPEEHDQQAARSQAYAQLIGKLGTLMRLAASPLDTVWFTRLLEIQSTVEQNSQELFMDTQVFNPYARKVRAELQTKLAQLEADIQAFATAQVSSTIQKEIL